MQKHLLKSLLLMLAIMVAPWVTQGQAFNYTCNFEDDSDTAGWMFVNGSQANQWFIGTATNNGGTKSLYISSDNGASNTYNTSSITFVYAYQEFSLDAGAYAISFDWKCQGEGGTDYAYDYVRVFLAPASASLTAGQSPSGGTSSYDWAFGSLPSGFIDLTNNRPLNQSSTWQNKFLDFYVPSLGTYRLVFAWANDASVGSSPSGAIDNIVFTQPTCPRPANLTFTTITHNSLGISWTETGTASQWVVALDSANTNLVTADATDTNYLFTDLSPNTYYTVRVASVCDGTDTSMWLSQTIHTPCNIIEHDSLPFVESFESWTTGSSSGIDPCWSYGSMGVSSTYPYASASYAATGSKSIYFYGYSSSYYCYLVMPMFEDSLSNLMVSFKLLKTSSTYGSIEVGVIENPDDFSTFHSLGTFMPDGMNIWESFAQPLSNYHGAGFICFVQRLTYYTYLDDVVVDVIPTCPTIRNLTFRGSGTTGAAANWGFMSGIIPGEPVGYDVEVIDLNTNTTAATMTTTVPRVLVTGLNPHTDYRMRVRANCDIDGYGPWDSVDFSTTGLPCVEFDTTQTDTIQFSNGTTSTNGTFVNSGWGNTFCQAIYNASDLHAAGLSAGRIKGMVLGYTAAGSYNKELTIFLGNTSRQALNSSTDMVNPNTLTQVYGPTVRPATSASAGWVYYEFDTPFEWDGSSNILFSSFMNQSGSSQSSSGFYAYSTNSGRNGASIHKYKDSNPFTMSDCMSSGNTTSSNTYLPSVTFIVDGCNATSSCAAPFVVTDSVSGTQIDISWAPGNDETSWELEYRIVGDTEWVYADIATTNSYSFINLTPNTEYQLRVTNHCSDTDMSTIIMVRTECAASALPFTENFESWATGSASPSLSCWYRYSSYSTGYPYITTGTSHSGGNKSMYFYSGSGTYSYLTLPVMAASIDSLQISFWLYSTYSGYSHAVEVGVMDDPTDLNTFTLIETVQPTTTYTWEPYEVPLNDYTGTGRYITLKSSTSSTTYPYLDDIEVAYISPCPRVRHVGSRFVTLSDATIFWDTTSATEYEIEYGPNGFAHGTGTVVSSIYDDSVAITGLSATSQYDVYVRGICDPDTGNWSFCYSFWTECGLIDSLPFGSNFNSLASEEHAPHCWYGYCSYDTYYPEADSYTDRYNSGSSLYTYMYGSGSYTIIQLPQVDTNELPIRTLQLEFSLQSTYGTGAAIVGVCTSQGLVNFTPLDTVFVNEDYNWHDFEVPLTNYSDTGSYVSLVMYSPSGNDLDLYIDEVHLVVAPTCVRPRNIRATTVTTTDALVRWASADSTQTDFEIRYGIAGCSVDTLTGTFVSNSDSLLLTGLDSGIVYSVFVRAICGADDTSFWTQGQFRTLASSPVSSYPYICDFTGSEGAAWNLENGTETNKWYLGTAAFSGTADSMAIYISNDNGSTNSYNTSSTSFSYAYRTFDMPAGQYAYSFDWRAQGESQYYDFIRVFLAPASDEIIAGQSPNGNTSSYSFASELPREGWLDLSLVTIAPYTLNQHSTWTNLNSTFTLTTGGTYNLVFAWSNDGSGGSNPAGAIDNVQIYRNTCPSPDNFRVAGNTGSSVTVAWDTVGTPTGYELSISTTSGSPSVDTVVTSSPVTFSGLTPGVTYYIYVRSSCDYGSDSSMWVGPISAIPGTWDMRANQTDTLRMCGGIIYDDGGATGAYSNNQTSVVIIYPDSPNNLVQISGTFAGEGCCDYLGIYDGVGTSAPQLHYAYCTSSGSTNNIGPYLATNGPLTLYFHSDASVTYPGFALNVTCVSTTCRVFNLQLDPAVPQSDVQLAVTWDTNGADYYEVAWGAPGFIPTTGMITTYTNSAVIPGLTSLTSYDVCVRSICAGGTDTGSWTIVTFQTALCDNAQVTAIGSETSSGTSYYAPVNNYYRYTLSETIIDSAELGGPTDIQYITYYYDYSSPSTDKTNCTIYFQPTTLSTFGSSSDVVPLDTATAVKVYTGPLNCTQGWNYFTLDTSYHYGGTTNLLVIVDDNSNDYNTSSYVFKTEPCTGNKVLYYYSDTYNPDVTSITSSYSGSKAVASWRPVMQLLSCGAAGCRQPVITGTTHTYESVTATWSGDGSAYEVNIKETTASDFTSADIPVVGNSHTFYGLQPATSYTFRVRTDCTADSLDYSPWVTTTVLTDSLPCLPPDSLTVTGLTNTDGTFDWVPFGYETM
ncbi:MAG: fibronectin type III domain-containing protein, partial [Bacteroidales bacterium]|nr:fibronectin type III domain-containing protein [Bacteroidales bacterium]